MIELSFVLQIGSDDEDIPLSQYVCSLYGAKKYIEAIGYIFSDPDIPGMFAREEGYFTIEDCISPQRQHEVREAFELRFPNSHSYSLVLPASEAIRFFIDDQYDFLHFPFLDKIIEREVALAITGGGKPN